MIYKTHMEKQLKKIIISRSDWVKEILYKYLMITQTIDDANIQV